jgi:hypothetical protein
MRYRNLLLSNHLRIIAIVVGNYRPHPEQTPTLHTAMRRAFGTTLSLLLHLAHLHSCGRQTFDQSRQDSPIRFRAALLSPMP